MSGLSSNSGIWIITGGAGYLGRGLFLKLRAAGIRCFAIDNFSTSHRIQDQDLFEGDLTDVEQINQIWKKIPGPVAGIFHFAAKALVGESHEKPDEYFRNNLMSSLAVAQYAGEQEAPPVIIHSSSCAVYGTPKQLPLTEESPLAPISPYGASKKMAEELFAHMAATQNIRVLNLRYFNPVGALEDGSHGEDHEPETHLVPNTVRAALQGSAVEIFGQDYPTPDGTCLRDYFHMEDLLDAHLAAAEYLQQQKPGFTDAINIGSGKATSVRQVVQIVEKTTGKKVQVKLSPPRPGDPAHLSASIQKAAQKLGWTPRRTLEGAISSHLNWLRKRA